VISLGGTRAHVRQQIYMYDTKWWKYMSSTQPTKVNKQHSIKALKEHLTREKTYQQGVQKRNLP
jgi:hypothetical protein